MSTRGIIGTANDGGFTGRYTHQDSYPTSRGPDLLKTYQELGSLAKVIAYAVRPRARGYWSSYEPPSEGDAGWTKLKGMGLISQFDHWDAEWAYLLAENGITVLRRASERQWDRIAVVAWDAENPNWEAIECGEDFERCNHYAWRHFPEAKDLRVGTAVWLGRELPSHSDLHALIDNVTGSRLELTGSGCTGSASSPAKWWDRNAPLPKIRYWWMSVRSGPDIRVFREMKTGHKLDPRYTGLVHTQAGERHIEPGTILPD